MLTGEKEAEAEGVVGPGVGQFLVPGTQAQRFQQDPPSQVFAWQELSG
jgi:hypothetical protein